MGTMAIPFTKAGIQLTCCGQPIYGESFIDGWNFIDGVLQLPGNSHCRVCGRTYGGTITVKEKEPDAALSTGKCVSVRRPDLIVHVNDSIRLEALTESGATKLRKWGCWWYVVAGSKHGSSWLLRSIKNQPREKSKTQVEVIHVEKQTPSDGDKDYVIVQVVASPEEFQYKKHHP